MKRTIKSFEIENIEKFQNQLFHWSRGFNEAVYLDSHTNHNHDDNYSNFDFLLAVDGFTSIKTDALNGFEKLNEFQKHHNDWLFGYLSFDLKEDTNGLISQHDNHLGFSDLYFFQPKKLIIAKENKISFNYLPLCDDEIDIDFKFINNIIIEDFHLEKNEINFIPKTSKAAYIHQATKLLNNIQLGNIYEVNYCVEFFDNQAEIDPYQTFIKLNDLTKSPFASFLRINDHFVMSASPERYLRKIDQKIISQPIKGTAKRFEDHAEDLASKNSLKTNAKEVSENVMIVDLVRNDLSITAEKNSVQVEELCEVYTFNQVHQMISTIVSQAKEEYSNADILKTTFPMGSMTGAPKQSALQLITEVENFKRGVYSGSIGYFEPNGNFDFNVVIRTLLYHAKTKYLSYSAGSALTAQANPEQEYEECLLKANIIHQVFKK